MTPFFKLSGAGNDFLALVEPSEVPTTSQIQTWCRRRQSIGADGLFVLTRQPGGVRMTHFNADGGRAGLCLNGSRCAVQLAVLLGWGADDGLKLWTDAGTLHGRRLDAHRAELSLPPLTQPPQVRALAVDNRSYDGVFIDVGIPHWVMEWPGTLETVPIEELGPRLRSHPDHGTAGANINFIRRTSREDFEIRTFERGVGETLACGTGVIASTASQVYEGHLDLPCRATTTGGFVLTVNGRLDGDRLHDVTLAGDARLVARGELLPGALEAP